MPFLGDHARPVGFELGLDGAVEKGDLSHSGAFLKFLFKFFKQFQLDPIKVRESSLEVVIFDAELQTRLLMKKVFYPIFWKIEKNARFFLKKSIKNDKDWKMNYFLDCKSPWRF